MNDDDRLDLYFQSRADDLDVAASEPSVATSRAGRRRARRLSGLAVAVVALTVGAVLASTGRDAQKIGVISPRAGGQNKTASALNWTSVEVPSGLAWATASTVADDGSIYALSTAPGPYSNDPKPNVLYHSTDGRSWEAKALPDGFRAGAITSSKGNLYAAGTAPAGGSLDLSVMASADGAATWSSIPVKLPHADLFTSHPKEVLVSTPVIADGPAGLMVNLRITAYPDVLTLAQAKGIVADNGYEFTATGVDVYAAMSEQSALDAKNACAGATTTVPPTDVTETTVVDLSSPCVTKGRPTIAGSYTWAELGVDPALVPLIHGETHTYLSTNRTTFTEVAAPSATGWVSALFGTSTGYSVLTVDPADANNTVKQYRSTDGKTWTSSGPDLSGWITGSGLLAGRPAAVAQGNTAASLLIADASGTFTSSDILGATGLDGTNGGLSNSAIGPLGFVGVVYLAGDLGNGVNSQAIIESADGVNFSSQPLSTLIGASAGSDWNAVGVTMNADAVTIRLQHTQRDDGNGGVTPLDKSQRLLVGTKR